MPNFDPEGGDMWMCQAPGHRGNRVMRSRVESEWRPDITGHKSAGNACPDCVREHDRRVGKCDHGLAKTQECLRCWLAEEQTADATFRQDYADAPAYAELLVREDYADNPAEYELQVELRRVGVRNPGRPEVCPHCEPAEQHQLVESTGMVGEAVLVCVVHGIVWEDAEDAIRRVY